MVSMPKQQRSAITTLRCIIKRMVVKNQEVKDALEKYIKDFDITNTLVRMYQQPAFASKPSRELLAMATSLPTQFARFSKVLPNP
jgi:hypothetical protein